MSCAADPERIAVSKSKGIRIDWKDGHRSEYVSAYLREQCPCASCTGAHGGAAETSRDASPFPMYKPPLKMLSADPVGNYALQINWNDGHNAGIYTFDLLRRICPCAECGAGGRQTTNSSHFSVDTWTANRD